MLKEEIQRAASSCTLAIAWWFQSKLSAHSWSVAEEGCPVLLAGWERKAGMRQHAADCQSVCTECFCNLWALVISWLSGQVHEIIPIWNVILGTLPSLGIQARFLLLPTPFSLSVWNSETVTSRLQTQEGRTRFPIADDSWKLKGEGKVPKGTIDIPEVCMKCKTFMEKSIVMFALNKYKSLILFTVRVRCHTQTMW